jgi:hypothetical protein
MEQRIILEFTNKKSAEICLYVINQLAAAYWESEGYTVTETPEGKALVGKNALTGEDMLNNEKTITWDKVKTSPDGTFYFSDPAQRTQFSEWKERAEATGYVLDGVSKPYPPEWVSIEG